MKTPKQTLLRRLILSTIILSLSACVTTQEVIIDSVTEITIFTRCGKFTTKAKIDTGADGLSIDARYAKKICLDERYIGDTTNSNCPNGQAWVTNAMGGQCRDRYVFRFEMGGKYIEDRITLTDRSQQRYRVLIGNRATEDEFIVRPIYQTNTEKQAAEAEEEEKN